MARNMYTHSMTYTIDNVRFEDSVTLEERLNRTELVQYMNRAWRNVRNDDAKPVKDLVLIRVIEQVPDPVNWTRQVRRS